MREPVSRDPGEEHRRDVEGEGDTLIRMAVPDSRREDVEPDNTPEQDGERYSHPKRLHHHFKTSRSDRYSQTATLIHRTLLLIHGTAGSAEGYGTLRASPT